ncbi:MAG: winged helix DNA-binding protein [Oscillospiraceae bacterium]|nr:winged helix DNA-binding protein [Oscillospiraceae bacterium]
MYYEILAGELLKINANLMQLPVSQQISRMVKGELFVLDYLSARGTAVHPKELSKRLSVSTARIASLLNHMEEKRLIVRTEDPRDSRQVLVQLTQEGVKAIEENRRETISQVSKMLESLGPDDAREYIRIQRKIYGEYLKNHEQ